MDTAPPPAPPPPRTGAGAFIGCFAVAVVIALALILGVSGEFWSWVVAGVLIVVSGIALIVKLTKMNRS